MKNVIARPAAETQSAPPAAESPAPDVGPQPAPDPLPRMPHRLHPRLLVGYGTLLGAAMIGAAWLWAGVLHGDDLGAWFPGARWAADLAVGALIGAGFTLIAWWLVRTVPALQRVERLFTTVLDMDALRFHHAVLFGLLAGVPEEVLFRGALQPTLGWLATSAIFGALHAITPAYFLYATAAGLLLGRLAIWREALWAPVAAHTAIDAIMFALLIRRWRRARRRAHAWHAAPSEPND